MTDETPRFNTLEPADDPAVDPAVSMPNQSGGFGASFEDRVNFGLYNGNFAKGPPRPADNIDPWNSAGSNFIPNWRFVQSSNANITGKQVRDTLSPSGSNFRFTFAAGSANDEAMIEQLAMIGGARDRVLGFALRPSFVNNGATTFTAWAEVAYLTVDGALVGAAVTGSSTVAAGATYSGYPEMGAPPTNAFQIRARAGVRRGAAATSATGSIEVATVRLERQLGRVRVPSESPNVAGGVAGTIFTQTAAAEPVPDATDVMYLQSGGRDYVWIFLSGLVIDKGIILNGVITPTQLTANTDNWNPTGLATCNVIRANSDASRNLTGIVAQENYRLIRLMNAGAQDIVLIHNATSTAANRFFCPGSVNLTLDANDWVDIFYDNDNDRWRVSGV